MPEPDEVENAQDQPMLPLTRRRVRLQWTPESSPGRKQGVATLLLRRAEGKRMDNTVETSLGRCSTYRYSCKMFFQESTGQLEGR